MDPKPDQAAPGHEAIIVAGSAEVVLACAPLAPTLDFFVGRLGFRIETIFPAEEPHSASLSGHGLRLRLEPGAGDPGLIRLAIDGPTVSQVLTAPNGTRIELVHRDPAPKIPPFQPGFMVLAQRDGPRPADGRAGMTYRDLIPSRLGGRFIASHITIPNGGPVADWVHFHKIGFQIIFCRRGWVRVVYEDQGPPFILEPGDCVLQPPRIRHRVLESSPGLEIVELGSPALHETLADHEMTLPTIGVDPNRDFGGQVFCRHQASETPWTAEPQSGFLVQKTGLEAATRGLVQVEILRAAGRRDRPAHPHAQELLFGFLLDGSAVLDCRGSHPLGPSDVFVIPPGEAWALTACSDDFSLLQVASPAETAA